MFKGHRISLIIPCLNEEEALPSVLSSRPDFIDEVIVVDNGSTDKTAQIAKKYGCVVINEKRRGYGQAYLAGIPRAGGDIIVTFDGDNTYYMSDIEPLLDYMIENNYDFINGCRFPLSDNRQMPLKKRLANILISWIIRHLFNIPVVDTQSGMHLFKFKIISLIFICNKGMGFSQELKIKLWFHPQICCSEMHIGYRERAGKSKFKPLIDSIKILINVFVLFVMMNVKSRNLRQTE